MKNFYTIVLITLLSSCTTTQNKNEENQDIINNNKTEIEYSSEKTEKDIESELSKMDTNEIEENKVVKLDATYTNPETDVDMKIEYSLDDEGKISTINVSATTYDLSKFNNYIQIVVGKTIDEARNTPISGGSLTNTAFKNALK